MLILFQSYFISNNFDFYLFCRTEIDSMEIIVIRIISKNIQFSSCHSSSSSAEIPVIDQFSTGIKISFQIGKMKSVFFDQIVRVPLHHEEYQRVRITISFYFLSSSFMNCFFPFLFDVGNEVLTGNSVFRTNKIGIA
jgi:hypothetical protein